MFGLSRWTSIKALLLILMCSAVAIVGIIYLLPTPPVRVLMATGFKGTGFHYFGLKYREAFARVGVDLDLRETTGAVENLELLQTPASGIQIAFVLGGISDGDRSPGLLSFGTTHNVAFWVFYARSETLDNLTQLKGKRVAVAPVGSGIRVVGEKVLGAFGINGHNTKFIPVGGDAAYDALEKGEVDAVWTTAAPDLPAIQRVFRNPNVRLLNIKSAEALSRTSPEFFRLDLPQGAINIGENIPPTDIAVVGARARVLVRSDLHPEIANLLLKVMTQIHSKPGIFQRGSDFPASSDPEYPMAQTAIDFYRDGPSFLRRQLPLWLNVYVQRIIVLIAAIVPLVFLVIGGEPQVYRWIIRERVRPYYSRLRILEREAQSALSAEQVTYLSNELETIDREASTLRLPGRYADSFFSLKVHINLIRIRLASRYNEFRVQTTINEIEEAQPLAASKKQASSEIFDTRIEPS